MRAVTALVALIFLGLAPLSSAIGQGDPLAEFYGDWVGVGVTADEDLKRNPVMVRDTDLTIARSEDGFDIKWKTLVSRGDKGGKPRTRTTVLEFATGDTPGQFKIKRADPALEAGSDAWAETVDGKLIVYLSSTLEDGKKVVSRYERLAYGNEMTLEYTLMEDNKVLRTVSGNLVRLKKRK
ncbi:MAG: hypothetical protein QNJ94_08235 [Alphaproteobacteria bacterium]|nr:hypothetical protein [Alphaproteobacteria bacterium]